MANRACIGPVTSRLPWVAAARIADEAKRKLSVEEDAAKRAHYETVRAEVESTKANREYTETLGRGASMSRDAEAGGGHHVSGAITVGSVEAFLDDRSGCGATTLRSAAAGSGDTVVDVDEAAAELEHDVSGSADEAAAELEHDVSGAADDESEDIEEVDIEGNTRSKR